MVEATKLEPLGDSKETILVNKGQLDEIQTQLHSFIEIYEVDMRGDKDLTNGNRGVIGEIRAIKETLLKYPSLSFVFSKNPLKTVGIILVGFVVLDTLSSFGLLRWLISVLGITVPAILTTTPVP